MCSVFMLSPTGLTSQSGLRGRSEGGRAAEPISEGRPSKGGVPVFGKTYSLTLTNKYVMKVLSVSNDSRRLKYKAARCIYTLPTVRDHPAQNLLSQKLLKPVVVRILLSL